MPTTDIDPHQALAAIERQILDGDTTVSAAALQKARAAAEFADLAAAGERRRAHLAADEARRAAEDGLRADIAAASDDLSRMRGAYGRLVESLRSFEAEAKAWGERRGELSRRAKAMGLDADVDVLPDLSRRDWVKTAADEAAGRYGTTSKTFTVGALTASRWRVHELHDAAARRRIDAEQVAHLERAGAATRERDERQQAERDATAALQKAQQAAADEAAAKRIAAATVAPSRRSM